MNGELLTKYFTTMNAGVLKHVRFLASCSMALSYRKEIMQQNLAHS
jgi:hypothetical protein